MPAVRIVYAFKDDSGETATTEIKMPDTTAFAEWIPFAVEMGNLIGALGTGALVNASICLDVDLSLFSGAIRTVLGTSDVEEKGFFQFLTSGGFPTRLNIPCFREDLVQAGSDAIDQTAPDVANFITAMTSGSTPGTELVEPCDSRGEDIVALTIAEERFKSR